MRYWLVLLLQFLIIPALPQTRTQISGTITDDKNQPLPNVTVKVVNTKNTTRTDSSGYYLLTVPPERVIISFSSPAYEELKLELNLYGRSVYIQNVTLKPFARLLDEVSITDKGENVSNIVTLNPKKFALVPAVSGNFESMLKSLPGVSTNNELTSQYSVRGGNFDENLIYVNDIELYRPLLVRNAQQEGLSLVNPELVDRVRFSAGGFEAKYGDKLSSVLDISYAKPDSLEISGAIGLLGSSLTTKLPTKSRTGYFLAGVRQKSNRSILRTQNTQGSYDPQFYDFQLLYSQKLNRRLSLNYFGNYNLTKFQMIPASSETEFGTSSEVFQLQVDYQGQENDRYATLMNAVTVDVNLTDQLKVRWLTSAFRISEQESSDLEGRYIFDEVQSGGNFPDVRTNRGVGTSIEHTRNSLLSTIYNTEIKGYLQKKISFWEGGIKYQYENLQDRLNEYSLTDSAGYTIPSRPDFALPNSVSAHNTFSTNRFSAYVQNSMSFLNGVNLIGGIRLNYNSGNDELLISPRLNLAYQPPAHAGLIYRFSAGVYSQPAYYREMLRWDGTVNDKYRAQHSTHLLAGIDKVFRWSEKPLKLSSEVYFKSLSRLTPYKIENLKVRYLPDQQAHGYATGVDVTVSGEFVKDLESAFRLSVMRTAEDIERDFYFQKDPAGNPIKREPGYLKRPTDQRVNFSVFFQDKLFKSPDYKVHLSLLYGSKLPVGPPGMDRYADVFKIPAYKRVDIGFSRDIARKGGTDAIAHRRVQSVIVYAEIFNLFDNRNTVSYLWLKDVNNDQYAIPNHLTGRVLNLKLIARIR